MGDYRVCYRCRCRVEKGYKHSCVKTSSASSDTQKIYNSTRWKKMSKYCKSIQPWCSRCMSTENIEVHHIKYITTNLELAYEISNTTNLCQNCHKEVHKLCRNGELDYVFTPLEYKYTL